MKFKSKKAETLVKLGFIIVVLLTLTALILVLINSYSTPQQTLTLKADVLGESTNHTESIDQFIRRKKENQFPDLNKLKSEGIKPTVYDSTALEVLTAKFEQSSDQNKSRDEPSKSGSTSFSRNKRSTSTSTVNTTSITTGPETDLKPKNIPSPQEQFLVDRKRSLEAQHQASQTSINKSVQKTEYFVCTVYEQSSVRTGAIIRMYNNNEIILASGTRIPSNTMIQASTTIKGDRVVFNIHSLAIKGAIFPCSFMSVGADGMEGVTSSLDASSQQVNNTLTEEVLSSNLTSALSVAGINFGRVASSLFRGNRSRKDREVEIYPSQTIIFKEKISRY